MSAVKKCYNARTDPVTHGPRHSRELTPSLRRFLQHVLAKGFVRIHHFGFLANRCRETKLAQIRRVLKVPVVNEENSGGKDNSMG